MCDTACKANADADGFPDHWLFHHRWANKAKGVKMPNGESEEADASMDDRWEGERPTVSALLIKRLSPTQSHRAPHTGAAIVFETIGGRTTAIVPSVQRARGGGAGGGGKQKKKGRAVAAAADTEDEKQQDSKPAATPATTGGGRKRKAAAALATAATGVVAEEEKEKKPRNKRGKAAGSDENEEAGGSKLAAVVKQRGRGSKKRA